jgi:hypothetical protein
MAAAENFTVMEAKRGFTNKLKEDSKILLQRVPRMILYYRAQ